MKLFPITIMFFIILFFVNISHASEFKKSYKMIGFLQNDFYLSENGATDVQESTFHIRRARLGIKGKALPNLSYNILGAYDGSNNASSQVKAFNLLGQYVLSKNHTLTFGQFKYTFDREGRRPAHQSPFIYFSQPTSSMINKLGRSGAALRDIGIELSGHHDDMSYHFGIINGNGINTTDHTPVNTSNSKDFYGRITLDVMENFNVGWAAYSGQIFDEVSLMNLDETIWTMDAEYKRDRWTFTGLLNRGRYETMGDDLMPGGYAIMGAYALTPKVDFLLRKQAFESDRDVDNTKLSSVDLGVNYYLDKKGQWGGSKISLNYLIRDAESQAKRRIWEDRGDQLTGDAVKDLLAFRLQLVF